VGAKAAVAVATATLVAAGAADLHKTSVGHRHYASPTAHAAPAYAPPVAVAPGTAQRTTPAHRVTAPAATTPAKHSDQLGAGDKTQTTPASSGSDQLPATQAGPGTFADTPPPPSTGDKPTAQSAPPTDPSTQPIGAPEPVQVQGFDPPPSSGGGSGSGSGSASGGGSSSTGSTSTSSSTSAGSP
jgi:hypothetical protein